MKKIIKTFASVRITVVCIFLLFVLTFWGTVAQVDHGLYAAQERYFNSFYFLALKVLPFPGAQGVLWVLFVNLICSVIVHFSKLRQWQHVGLKLVHAGILFYFIAAFITMHTSEESYLHLGEGEASNVSASYELWEVAYWKKEGNRRDVVAVDIHQKWVDLPFSNVPFTFSSLQFFENADAYAGPASESSPMNISGITSIEGKPKDKDREKNVAGGLFGIRTADGKAYSLLLYGAEDRATPVVINNETYYFILRPKRYLLPFTLKLDKFVVEYYPSTKMAKTYESFVQVINGAVARAAHIYMNNPLRDKGYTFYQASFSIDAQGRKYSTLAVVKNAGQLLPYIACGMVVLGLLYHFMWAFFKRKS